MDLDRQAIERRDFPIGRRGYDAAAVDAHLQSAGRASSRSCSAPPRAAAADVSLASSAGTPGAEHHRGRRDAAGGNRARRARDARQVREDGRPRRRADPRRGGREGARARRRGRAGRPRRCSSASARWTPRCNALDREPARRRRAARRRPRRRSRAAWASSTTRPPAAPTPRRSAAGDPRRRSPAPPRRRRARRRRRSTPRRRPRSTARRRAGAPQAIRAAPAAAERGAREGRRPRRRAPDRAEHGAQRRVAQRHRALPGRELRAARPAEADRRGLRGDRRVGAPRRCERADRADVYGGSRCPTSASRSPRDPLSLTALGRVHGGAANSEELAGHDPPMRRVGHARGRAARWGRIREGYPDVRFELRTSSTPARTSSWSARLDEVTSRDAASRRALRRAASDGHAGRACVTAWFNAGGTSARRRRRVASYVMRDGLRCERRTAALREAARRAVAADPLARASGSSGGRATAGSRSRRASGSRCTKRTPDETRCRPRPRRAGPRPVAAMTPERLFAVIEWPLDGSAATRSSSRARASTTSRTSRWRCRATRWS